MVSAEGLIILSGGVDPRANMLDLSMTHLIVVDCKEGTDEYKQTN